MVLELLAPWCNLPGFIPSNPPGGQNLLSSLFSPVFPLPAENGLFSKLISTPPAYPPPARLPSVVIIVVSIFNPIFRSSCCYRRFSQFCAFLPDSSNARHPHIWHSARSFHYAAEYFVNDQGAALWQQTTKIAIIYILLPKPTSLGTFSRIII